MSNILLDVTRLNTRKRASTPSGIDRVDIRYLKYFDNDQNEFVIAWLGCLFLANKNQLRKLRKGLEDKWQGGSATHSLPTLVTLIQGSILELALVSIVNLLPKKLGLKRKYSLRFKRFATKTNQEWLYINTSHVQIRSIEALRQLSTILDVQTLFYIHDLIPITHQEYVRPGGAEQHERRLQLLLDLDSRVAANSQFTKDELLKWSRRKEQPIAEEQVSVIPIGVEPDFTAATHTLRPIYEPYFLMLGTIEPRKNHLLVLNVWRKMVEDDVENIPKLAIIGKRGWENENIVDMLDRCQAIQPYIIEKQDIPDAELKAWLQHCEAMIYPSFVEGWGMPVAEALAMSKRVICSDIPPFKEVGQGVPDYIDPLDGKALRALVDRKVASVSKTENSKAYEPSSWDTHFQQLSHLITAMTPPVKK